MATRQKKSKNKVVHILGVRPHIIKFTPITDKDIIVWTGQHFDLEMSEYLLREFKIPDVDYDLKKTNIVEMQEEITKVLEKEKPSLVVVYGDTTSTLAGTMAAYCLGIRIAHIESGVRSEKYPHRVENEIRLIVDNHSDYLFCPTERAYTNLVKEGIEGAKFIVGDPHYDEYVKHRQHQGVVLATFHRAEHTDSFVSIKKIFDLLKPYNMVVFPCHPRTAKAIKAFNIKVPKNIRMMPPASYREMQRLYDIAMLVVTDSGGVTKEAHFAGCPVLPYEVDEWDEIFMFGDGNSKKRIKEILLKRL